MYVWTYERMYECTCKFIICRQMKYCITKSLTFTTTNYIYTFSIYTSTYVHVHVMYKKWKTKNIKNATFFIRCIPVIIYRYLKMILTHITNIQRLLTICIIFSVSKFAYEKYISMKFRYFIFVFLIWKLHLRGVDCSIQFSKMRLPKFFAISKKTWNTCGMYSYTCTLQKLFNYKITL